MLESYKELIAAKAEIKMLKKQLEEAIKAIPEWISIKDRLPEKNGTVLGCYVDGDMEFLVYCKGEFLSYDEDGYPHKASYVTHWMPLPEQPKKVKLDAQNNNPG